MTSIHSASPDGHGGSAIRQSYLRFGRWSQPLWTLLTGKALPGEQPLLRIAPLYTALLTVVALAGCSWLQLTLLSSPERDTATLGYLLTPLLAIGMGGAWRAVQVVYAHHAIHGTLIEWRREANTFASKCLTVFALAQNQDDYEREHLDHHRRNIFTTLEDADASLLYKFGIRPGMARATLRQTLVRTLFSPGYHLWFVGARLRSNMRRPLGWKIAVLAWIGVLFVALPLYFGLVPAMLAVWLPLIVVYQMSALLQFATEHMWLLSAEAPVGMRGYAERCHGRFCGEMVPGGDGHSATVAAWLGWTARLLVLHLPARICVLVGDMPAHDWHHLCGQIRHSQGDWPSAIYQRQRAIDSGLSAGMETRELWGIHNMVTHVLDAMAAAPDLQAQSAPMMRRA